MSQAVRPHNTRFCRRAGGPLYSRSRSFISPHLQEGVALVESLLTAENAIAFVTLTVLEIVLGIDNIVFIAILTGKLDASERNKARRAGLAAAMIMRILLLLCITWIMGLTSTLLTLRGHEVTGKDLILIAGGLFLLGKSTREIHDKLEGPPTDTTMGKTPASIGAAVGQIMVLDLVFSIDSVITAVGMARHLTVMIAAVVTAVGAMMVFASPVCDFVERHPTMKVLALSFLILIGVTLVAEGAGSHLNRGYIYFAMAFSFAVELLHMRIRKVAG